MEREVLVQIPLGKEGSHKSGFPCLSTIPEEAAEPADHPALSQLAPGLMEAASSCCRVTGRTLSWRDQKPLGSLFSCWAGMSHRGWGRGAAETWEWNDLAWTDAPDDAGLVLI